MTYGDFKEQVMNELERRLPDCRIQQRTVTKNNGKTHDALTVMEEGAKMSPVFYLDEAYAGYLSRGMKIDEAVDGILEEYGTAWDMRIEDISRITDFSRVKDRIIYRLVSRERNRELLEDAPHAGCIGDLAAVFFVLVSAGKDADAVLLVRNRLMQLWDTDREELYGLAEKNTPGLLGWELINMQDILSDLAEPQNWGDFMAEGTKFPMYVLTNRTKLHGAGCLLYPGLLEEVAEKLGGGFYVLPSSVHETLLVPEKAAPEPEELTAMIREVNGTQVLEEEVLSDHPYHYSAEDRELKAA